MPLPILFGEDQGRYLVTTRNPGGARDRQCEPQLFAIDDWHDWRDR